MPLCWVPSPPFFALQNYCDQNLADLEPIDVEQWLVFLNLLQCRKRKTSEETVCATAVKKVGDQSQLLRSASPGLVVTFLGGARQPMAFHGDRLPCVGAPEHQNGQSSPHWPPSEILQWAREHQNWTTVQWKRLAWSDNGLCFLLPHVDSQVRDEGRSAEAVRRPGRCSTGKPRVLGFTWMLLWHEPTTLTSV